ncbi:MAG: sugar ABC transporter permease [Muribaculaceae bacterium]|nr:sugar ABC transporter permease [Muribaculaceae bacterium]
MIKQKAKAAGSPPKRENSPKNVKTTAKKAVKKLKSDGVFPYLCLAPSLAGVLVFFIIPFFVIIYYSMVDSAFNKDFVFLDNYIAIVKNSSFRRAAVNTLTFSAVAVPLAVVLSLMLAMLLDCKIPFVSQFRTSFLCAMMVPVASIVLIWQVIFHYNGVMNDFIARFGAEPVDWLKSGAGQFVIIALFLWKNLGYNMILFLSAINNIPTDLMEVATLEGASPAYRFFKIKLRYLSPTILFVTILSLINSFKVFREVYLLTGDYPYTSLYMLQHFMNNTFRNIDYQKLSSAAILMAIVMIIIIGGLFIAENKFGEDVESD